MRGQRIRLAVWGLALVAAYWLVLVLFAEWQDADWPDGREDIVNFVVGGIVVSFLLIKSWLMAARTVVPTRLGASLIAVNLWFGVLYAYIMAGILWPAIRVWVAFTTPPVGPMPTYDWRLIDGIRIVLALLVIWGVIELILTPDPPKEDEDPWALLAEVSEEAERLRQENIVLRARLHAGYD